MDVVPPHGLDRLRAVVGFKDAVLPAGEINFQRGDDVAVVVADQNVVHGVPLPCPTRRRRPSGLF